MITSYAEQEAPIEVFSMASEVTKISTLIVEEILAIFYSMKASRDGIGFFN